ncbi:hypothetical protein K2173_000610 [Erythroxylum novogranatense]|uniref:Disease resistance protein RPM1-like n=1 Tax=Erythroxylum novogranatense TaxID=1862640 RepID=A0AAV8S7V5_9ROSI|nr:hypothetical protein K2173_000610 [Erythroxylum novogranatense]
MADGAVNFLLDKLTTILLQKASLLGDVCDEIEKIKLELESMRSFIRDAERRKVESKSAATWMKQVRDVAYEVEDIVDEFMHHRDREMRKSDFKGIVQDVVNFPKRMCKRHYFSSKLQHIKSKVQEVSERSQRYGFVQLDEANTTNVASDIWQQYGDSSIFVDEDEIVGMEANTEQLLGWLMEEEPRRTIISIVGMGGLGKTTLVTRVYNNQIIKRWFDCWAWMSVSQTFGVDELLRSMIKELFATTQLPAPDKLGSLNYRELLCLFNDYLHQKRYVIVLDDVWSIDLWSRIRAAFPNNKHRSRIILTTRNENVAASVGIGSIIHRLEHLQEKEAWSLFCKKAFWNDPDHRCPKEIQSLAEAIMKKCQGLPLAIVAVGGLMCSKSKTVGEWRKVYESINWQLSNNQMLESLKGVLLSSFNDLPFYLKQCFLYCCVFRDGYPIKTKNLIRLWIAEGFISGRKGMTMEEIAEEYLMELILRSMIQVTETNDAGRAKTCRLHDVMRELAMTMSEKENFCTSYEDHQSRMEGKVHQLSIYNTVENIRISTNTSHHLRSFFVFPTDACSSFSLTCILSKFRLLRILNVEGVPVEAIPSALVKLFNLRYLNLRNTKIRELPKSMGRLKYLQTLDVRNTFVQRLPSGISKLSKLRHLCMYQKIDQTSETSSLRSMQVPAGIWNIKSLQTLAYIEADKELIQHLGNLSDLKKLEITKVRAEDGQALCSSIKRMTGLISLGVMASSTDEELQLEALHLPPLFLQKLTLFGKLNRLPGWVGSLASLSHLSLGHSCLKEDLLPSLHLLSSLMSLQLKNAYDGTFMHFKAGWFPKLIKLSFQDLARLDIVKLEEGSLPSIRELYLIRCQKMNKLPSGIQRLTGLQKLHLEEMPEELMQGFQDLVGEDQENVQHIATIKLIYISEGKRIVEEL